jgi:hypothetical protein
MVAPFDPLAVRGRLRSASSAKQANHTAEVRDSNPLGSTSHKPVHRLVNPQGVAPPRSIEISAVHTYAIARTTMATIRRRKDKYEVQVRRFGRHQRFALLQSARGRSGLGAAYGSFKPKRSQVDGYGIPAYSSPNYASFGVFIFRFCGPSCRPRSHDSCPALQDQEKTTACCSASDRGTTNILAVRTNASSCTGRDGARGTRPVASLA